MPASPECQHTEIVPGTNFLPVHAEPSKPGVKSGIGHSHDLARTL